MLKDRHERTLKNSVSDGVRCAPLIRLQQVGQDVDQSADLLVALLRVLEVRCDVETLALLVRVADALASLLFDILLGLALQQLWAFAECSLQFGVILLFIFVHAWLLTADARQTIEDASEQSGLNRLLTKLNAG